MKPWAAHREATQQRVLKSVISNQLFSILARSASLQLHTLQALTSKTAKIDVYERDAAFCRAATNDASVLR